MRIKDLEVGKIYECRLSMKKVLVCEVDKEVSKVKKVKGKDEIIKQIEKAKIGKSSHQTTDGTWTYKHDELFDGQLTELETTIS